MKPIICSLLILAVLFFSCSSPAIRETNSISGIKKSGLIFRLSNGSKISQKELSDNTLYWLNNFENNSGIIIVLDPGESLSLFKYTQERFYQLSNEKKFLKYKSIGVLNLYLQRNRTDLLRIMTENGLDSIIIYEAYNIISTEMQFLDYDAVIAIADKNLNIIFLDHSTDHIDTNSAQLEELKSYMMDELDGQLTDTLQDLKLLGSRTKISASSTQPDNTVKVPKKTDETVNSAEPASAEEMPGPERNQDNSGGELEE